MSRYSKCFNLKTVAMSHCCISCKNSLTKPKCLNLRQLCTFCTLHWGVWTIQDSPWVIISISVIPTGCALSREWESCISQQFCRRFYSLIGFCTDRWCIFSIMAHWDSVLVGHRHFWFAHNHTHHLITNEWRTSRTLLR